MSRAAEEIAAVLLDTGAFLVRPEAPFRLTSGLNAPFYVNCRLILSRPEARAHGRRRRWRRPCRSPAPRSSPAASPQASPSPPSSPTGWRSPWSTSAPRPRRTAPQGASRAATSPAKRVHLIEDLISTAGSILAFAQALRDAGAEVDRVSVLFSRASGSARQALEEAGLALTAICDLDALLAVALSRGRIDEQGLEEVRAFLADPEGWSARHGA